MPKTAMGIACILFIFLGFTKAIDLNHNPGSHESLEQLSEWITEFRQTNPQKALEYGKLVLKKLENSPNRKIKIDVLNGMCWAHGVLGNYGKALDLGKEAEILGKELKSPKQLAVTYGSLANLYLNLSDFHRALDYSLKAISAGEEANYTRGIVSALVSTARIQRNLKDYEKALQNYQKARELSMEMGNESNIAWILNNLGTAYWDMKEYSKALDHYFQGLKKMEKLENDGGKALILNNIGCVYSDMGKFRQALTYDLKSMEINKKMDNRVNLAYALRNLGRDYGNLGNYTLGLEYLNESNKMADELGIKDLQMTVYQEFSRVYENMGRFKPALTYYKRYKELGETVINEDRNRRIAHLQVIYDVEKKQKENQLLKKNNHIQELELARRGLKLERQRLLGKFLVLVTLLLIVIALVAFNRYRIKKKAEQELLISGRKLAKLNESKDKLFTIIAHDLGNPLNNILLNSGYLNRHLDHLDIKELKETARGIYRQTQGLADLLANLLQWATLQIGKIERYPETFDILELTEETLRLLEEPAGKKQISLVSNVMEDTLALADKNMTKTVLRNLVSNALKYTRPGGEIIVSSREKGDKIEVTVSDNGVGMDEKKVKELFSGDMHLSTPGTENEKGTGLGLVLCREFTRENGGEIQVKSEVDQGSHFNFTLPKSP